MVGSTQFDDFDWDDGNVHHLALHGITPQEAEEVLLNRPMYLGVSLRDGELRREELGATLAQRVLRIVTTTRGRKIRVVTGWPAGRVLRSAWLEQVNPLGQQETE